MAKIVAAIGTSHGPQLKTPPVGWADRGIADRRSKALVYRAQDYQFEQLKALREDFSAEIAPDAMQARWDACQAALDRLGQYLRQAQLDVLVIVSSDHKEIYTDELLPAFAVYWGDDVAHVPFTAADLAKMPPGLAAAALGDVPAERYDHPPLPPGAGQAPDRKRGRGRLRRRGVEGTPGRPVRQPRHPARLGVHLSAHPRTGVTAAVRSGVRQHLLRAQPAVGPPVLRVRPNPRQSDHRVRSRPPGRRGRLRGTVALRDRTRTWTKGSWPRCAATTKST